MSLFWINIVVRNPKDESVESEPVEAIVDTRSELMWVPAEILANAGIQPRRLRSFTIADGDVIQREVGCAILRAEGYETTDEVMFGLPSDLIRLGVRTHGGFGVMADNLAHRLVATTTIAAPTEVPR